MASHRPASTSGNGAASIRRVARLSTMDGDADDNAQVRVLLLDDDPDTPQLIENALWTWPHRIALTGCAADAITMCRHLQPAALIVSLEYLADRSRFAIAALREELPDVVMIALTQDACAQNRGTMLELGASAVLTRDELQRPSLHNLLMRLQQEVSNCAARPISRPEVALSLPWRESGIIGSLVCDIRGNVKTANDCLAAWLGYPGGASLIGKRIGTDLICDPADWASWKSVAGDVTALLHSRVVVKACDQRLHKMDVEVFAAPHSPTEIQAVFVYQAEIELVMDGSVSG